MSSLIKSVADSERVKVNVAVSPFANVETSDVIAIVGLCVSTLSVTVLFASLPSALALLKESLNLSDATLITPFVVLSSVGVNVAV